MASGVKIAALYGIYPCQLGLCGPQEKSAEKLLFDYLSGKEISEKKVRKILEQFKGAFPYYKLIAKNNGIKDPFNERIIKAYWIGNELLDRVPVGSLKEMIVREFSEPLSKKEAEKKADEIPQNSRPHHNFHVFVIGSVTGRVKLEGKLLDICRVGWGEVVGKNKDKIIVKYQPIKKSRNKYFLGDFVRKNILWGKDLAPEPEIGDKVSFHWNHLVQILNRKDLFNLKRYTQLTLESLNG